MEKTETRYYRIGSVGIMYKGPAFSESESLSIFRTDSVIPDIFVEASISDPLTETDEGVETGWTFRDNKMILKDDRDKRTAVVAEYINEGHISVLIDKSKKDFFGTTLFLRMLRFPHYVLSRGAFFLHSSFIDVDGEAVLFTAPSGVGKSTQASLWEKHRGARVINGDRALLRRENGIWLACGSPYCGTSKICHNKTMPVRAIVILSQAKANTAQRCGVSKAFSSILEGSSYDPLSKTEVEAVSGIAADLISSVPFFTLTCTPDVRAVDELEKVL